MMQHKIHALIKKGVSIPNPESVLISEEVDVSRISGKGVVLYPGCKILGDKTLLLDQVKVGTEGPATIDNCQIGPEVELKSGYFSQAVFLEKASLGSGSHVRKGTILEEQASTAHTVGLKQTILFPFVTLGSLINFCDCLMAGGTSRKNHSEVGSAFIHFNYTPNQDKATPSMMGDVPGGVMLNQTPIFLGGQGGLVGPVRLAFGTITAAGTIYRKDELRENRLLLTGFRKDINMPFQRGRVPNCKRIVFNNLLYIAHLVALHNWYVLVRTQFVAGRFPQALLDGLLDKLSLNLVERLNRLNEFAEKVSQGDPSDNRIQELVQNWTEIQSLVQSFKPDEALQEMGRQFRKYIITGIQDHGLDYLAVIQNLDPEAARSGSVWLQQIVDQVMEQAVENLPLFDFVVKKGAGKNG